MRNLLYTLLLLSVIVLVAGCGGKATDSPAQAPGNQPPSSANSTEASASQAQPAPQVRGDVPLLEDAAGLSVTSTPEGYSVLYTSGSDIDAAATFYQAQMPALGWTYHADISTQVGDVSRVLAFTKENEEAAVSLTSAGASIQVNVAISPQKASQADVSEAVAAAPSPTDTPLPPTPTPLPPPPTDTPQAQPPASVDTGSDTGSDTGPDIPLMPDAAEVTRAAQGDQRIITYSSAGTVDDIVQFYSDEMPRLGWEHLGSESSAGTPGAAVHFVRSLAQASVSIVDLGLKRLVTVAVTGAAQAPPPPPPSTPAASPTEAPSQPAQPAGPTAGRDDIPVMADAVGLQTGGGEDDFSIIYTSPSPLDTVVAFYQAQMPPRGWAFQPSGSTHVPGVTAVLYFEKAGDEATVTITLQGSVTSVEVVIH